MTEITVLNCIAVFVLCYLIGSIPIAYIFVKAKTSKDITKEGSGNVGTLNSFTVTKSKSVGAAVLLLDLLKGLVPVYVILSVISLDYFYASLGASAIILGHNYPVWLKFKGGRGLAPGAGIFLVLNYFVVIGWGVVWLIVFLFKKKVLISNTIATFSLPLYVLIINLFDFLVVGSSYPGFAIGYFTIFSVIITVIILSKHREVFKEISNKN